MSPSRQPAPEDAPIPGMPWVALTAAEGAGLLAASSPRWWLSGAAAVDHWTGVPNESGARLDVSVLPSDLMAVLDGLPNGLSAWVEGAAGLVPVEDPAQATSSAVRLFDRERGAWIASVHVEDGAEDVWMYRRDPRLQRPWAQAVVDVGGIRTAVPAIVLLWKALRPSPADDAVHDRLLPLLDETEKAWLDRALLSVHPHSSWAIRLRSPQMPGRASWNRR